MGDSPKGEKSGVSVMVRVRPFAARELGDNPHEYPTSIVMMDGKKVNVLDANHDLSDSFEFHETFWSIPPEQNQFTTKEFADQEAVFQRTGIGAVANALKGYHTCILAYGQTGSGKTHTMLGSIEDPGIAPRLVNHLFEELDRVKEDPKHQAWHYSLSISFMEIYNERVKDLLGGKSEGIAISRGKSMRKGSTNPPSRTEDPPVSPKKDGSGGKRRNSTKLPKPPPKRKASFTTSSKPTVEVESEYSELKVRHSPATGTFVEGLTRLGEEDGIHTADDVMQVMRNGMEYRAVAATAMNDTSSRSHAIFQICLTAKNSVQGVQRYAHINIVDLAGSERIKMSKAEGQTLTEATKINQSLSTLRRVIDILIENSHKKKNQPKQIPPYRDSMLTWILSESLGGNSKTIMIATISPAESNREDTVNTLRYALKAKAIVNTVKVNEQKSSVLMSAMQKEMEHLRQQLNDPSVVRSEEEIEEMRQQQEMLLQEMERQAQQQKEAAEELERRKSQIEQAEAEVKKKQMEEAALKKENIEEKLKKEAEAAKHQEELVNKERSRLAEIEMEKERKFSHLMEEKEQEQLLKAMAQQASTAQKTAGHESAYVRKAHFREAFLKAFNKDRNALKREALAQDILKTRDKSSELMLKLEQVGVEIRDMESNNVRLGHRVDQINKQLDRRVATVEAGESASKGEEEKLQRVVSKLDKENKSLSEQLAILQRRLEVEQQTATREKALLTGKQEKWEGNLKAATDKSTSGKKVLEEATTQIKIMQRLAEELKEESKQSAKEVETNRIKINDLRREISSLVDENQSLEEELQRNVSKVDVNKVEIDSLQRTLNTTKEEVELLRRKHNDLRRFATERFFPNGSVPLILTPSWVDDPTSGGDVHREWVNRGYRYPKRQTSPVRRSSTMTSTPGTSSHRETSPFSRGTTATLPASPKLSEANGHQRPVSVS